MKLHPQATKGHLLVGLALILLSLGSLIASFILDTKILPFLVFFFGVWGGIETGRYLEACVVSYIFLARTFFRLGWGKANG